MFITEPLFYGGVCVTYCPGASSDQINFCPPELTTTNITHSLFGFSFTQTYCSFNRSDIPLVTFPASTTGRAVEGSVKYFSLVNRCAPTFKFINATKLANSTALSSALSDISDI